uniref:Ribosomal protein L37 n=1 Tax=Arcella intermedia TaxID=1963864 RepID=A0A6B2LTE0_9EUKA
MTKGTFSFGRRHTKVHDLCRRCGKHSFHIRKERCAACGYGHTTKIRTYNWSEKSMRRRTTGSGRMMTLKNQDKKTPMLTKFSDRHAALVRKQLKKNLMFH